LTWACVLLRPSAVSGVGLLDERYFMYWEDVEYSQRLTAAGWRMQLALDAHATHATSSSHARSQGATAMYSVAGLLTYAEGLRGLPRRMAQLRGLARYVRAVGRNRQEAM